MGKSRAVIGWKSINERPSFVYNLYVENEFFLSAEGGAGLEVLIKMTLLNKIQ